MLFVVFVAVCSLIAYDISLTNAEGVIGYPDQNEKSINVDQLRSALNKLALRLQNYKRKRSCNINIHSTGCILGDLLRQKEADNYLRSPESPGKRNIEQSDVGPTSAHESPSDLFYAQSVKRSCRFRLGGHCLTEALDHAANQYYYLKSPESPGRRRRHLSGSKFTNMKHISLS